MSLVPVCQGLCALVTRISLGTSSVQDLALRACFPGTLCGRAFRRIDEARRVPRAGELHGRETPFHWAFPPLRD
jgi:hypothetical protein